MFKTVQYIEVSGNADSSFSHAFKSKRRFWSSVVLVANTHHVSVRIAEVQKENLTNDEQWALVKSNFPYGASMNADTHLFDGCIFVNEKLQIKYFMVALSKKIADSITNIGIDLAGNLHRINRIDTIEHLLCRNYNSYEMIIFPQELGLRIIYFANNLPERVRDINNHPSQRDDEFRRFFAGFEQKPANALILQRGTMNIGWLKSALEGHGVDVMQQEWEALRTEVFKRSF